ncbi:MAG: sigma-54-dependent Fis family transcriptional regulator [Gemmatimonadetes bacterium]|nr:sigma-54-dependent Fis family transcriptional regulator [Gemmatimonadota bacterium]
MPDTVLITTTDLEPAVRLRDAFEEAGFVVELLTSADRIADVREPVLLVLTGDLGGRRAQSLVAEAAALQRLPVLGLADAPAETSPGARRRLGLSDVFLKPVEPAEVVLVGRRLIDRRRLRGITGIVGETEGMQEVLERVVQIAPVNSTVLITGESGTGKELVARGIHALSGRRHQRFIAANVAALPETLLESELFGHEKGAFTGAIAQRKGFFELAHKGTLFLDEIGEMPLATQSKLLRVLEEREFMRVGGEDPIAVDVRVIAATNQDLRQLVELGGFRRDLYYRLNVLSIHLPALRERREDIPVLVDAFIRQMSEEHGLKPVTLAPETMQLLLEYDWPGNVRELRNLVESMVVLAPGRVIMPEDLPLSVRDRRPSQFLPAPIPRAEAAAGTAAARGPELEFIFRTLVGLKIDVEDLRREFEEFRRSNPQIEAPVAIPSYTFPYATTPLKTPLAIEDATLREDPVVASPVSHPSSNGAAPPDDDALLVIRAGMTMDDIEREAIIAALKEVRGNRRKAAEMLGIGERTLYRKIKEYGIPL